MADLYGTAGDDELFGSDGNDKLYGKAGDDYLYSQGGNDKLYGEAGNDRLYSVKGNDSLDGGAGNDFLEGSDGNDKLYGKAGNDYLYSQGGNDKLYGEAGNDQLYSGKGNDSLCGGAGDDGLYGSSGNQAMQGGKGNDRLWGGKGNDRLSGGNGNDIINGSGFPEVGEIDTLTGGSGSDKFILGNLSRAFYNDGKTETEGISDYALITDFNHSQDEIQLYGTKNDYFLAASPSGLAKGTAVYLDQPDGEEDELIAIVQGSADPVLNSDDFSLQSAEFNLSDLNGSNGFVLKGIGGNDRSGVSLSTAGDFNGDGFDDLLVGANNVNVNGQLSAGSTYVVFGSSDGFDSSLNFSELNGSNGFVLNGIHEDDRSGSSVSTAGDINGDGFDDILIGAGGENPKGQAHAGSTYVVFGSSDGFGSSLSLSQLDGSNGFVVNGINADDALGNSVSAAGDINGDGFDDLAIGAVGAAVNGQEDAGSAYVLFGSSDSFDANFDLEQLDGSNGFVLNGIHSGDLTGAEVSSAGDINSDGFDDLLIGAPSANAKGHSYAGATYVVFGSSNGFDASFNLDQLNGSNGFVINGIHTEDFLGNAIASAGDINSDGFDDFLLGANYADPNGQEYAGSTYVVFGSGDFDASLNLDQLDGSNGFVIDGSQADDFSGTSVSTAGDFNGDGFDDLLIGASNANSNGQEQAGSTYLVFGSSGGFAARLNLSQLDGSNGFVLNGVHEYDLSGRPVSAAGDVNGDGFDDIMIGAIGGGDNGRLTDDGSPGESYVVFGRNFTSAVTHLGT